MALWTACELNTLFQSQLPATISITGVSIDSRTLQPGDLYIALKGVTQDGHLYLSHALEKGASAILVSHLHPHLSCPQIVVKDTLEALNKMAIWARQRSQARIIAVTGSVGKTSTKEILAHTLAGFGPVHISYMCGTNISNHTDMGTD